MTKDELIAKQQLEIEEYKQMNDKLWEVKERVYRELFCIGGPLNDNVLLYSKEQLKPFFRIRDALDL